MTRLQRTRQILAGVLLSTGLLALGYAAYVIIDVRAYQATEHRRLAETRSGGPDGLRRRASGGPPMLRAKVDPRDAVLADGGVVGEIRVPRLGLTAIVVQGDSSAILERAVGHLAETALPGESGNVVLAGHRDTFFRPLNGVRAGDTIAFTTHDGDFEYVVEWTAVMQPSDVHVIEPTDHPALTLITCFPFSYLGPAPDRFIVRARQTSF